MKALSRKAEIMHESFPISEHFKRIDVFIRLTNPLKSRILLKTEVPMDINKATLIAFVICAVSWFSVVIVNLLAGNAAMAITNIFPAILFSIAAIWYYLKKFRKDS